MRQLRFGCSLRASTAVHQKRVGTKKSYPKLCTSFFPGRACQNLMDGDRYKEGSEEIPQREESCVRESKSLVIICI